ncbi:MAG: nicotinate-nucleotide adenylyltransferase [Lachnospiraceae bacterium]|nr:nicotinate-nucleotide adenylyltransferase [Lachnospiraceae bacterium]MDY5741772.1 nicotinate-nucleotide adenylyltransferase [Lachnospiraceae bacterium]
MKQRRKLGILGGTFDPIHNGHLMLGQCALDQLELDCLLFIPSGNPPHKQESLQAADAVQRLEMVRLAVKGRPGFSVSDLDCQTEEPSYTVRLLQRLQQQYPDSDLFFILGADSLFQLESWYQFEAIFPICHLIVAKRNEQSAKVLQDEIQRLTARYGARITELVFPGVDISSSYIRRHYQKPAYLQDLIPEAVYRYISRYGLYQLQKQPQTGRYCDLLPIVQDVLSAKRFMHVMGVVYTAASLANHHGADREHVMLAALLHDFAKEQPNERLLQLAQCYSLPVRDVERRHPYLLHGAVAAALAQADFGIENQDVLNAMRYHTTGRPGMSLIEKIIFLADYIEPLREHASNLDEIRNLAWQDLDAAVRKVSSDTLQYLKEQQRPIDEMTALTYQYYLREEQP